MKLDVYAGSPETVPARFVWATGDLFYLAEVRVSKSLQPAIPAVQRYLRFCLAAWKRSLETVPEAQAAFGSWEPSNESLYGTIVSFLSNNLAQMESLSSVVISTLDIAESLKQDLDVLVQSFYDTGVEWALQVTGSDVPLRENQMLVLRARFSLFILNQELFWTKQALDSVVANGYGFGENASATIAGHVVEPFVLDFANHNVAYVFPRQQNIKGGETIAGQLINPYFARKFPNNYFGNFSAHIPIRSSDGVWPTLEPIALPWGGYDGNQRRRAVRYFPEVENGTVVSVAQSTAATYRDLDQFGSGPIPEDTERRQTFTNTVMWLENVKTQRPKLDFKQYASATVEALPVEKDLRIHLTVRESFTVTHKPVATADKPFEAYEGSGVWYPGPSADPLILSDGRVAVSFLAGRNVSLIDPTDGSVSYGIYSGLVYDRHEVHIFSKGNPTPQILSIPTDPSIATLSDLSFSYVSVALAEYEGDLYVAYGVEKNHRTRVAGGNTLFGTATATRRIGLIGPDGVVFEEDIAPYIAGQGLTFNQNLTGVGVDSLVVGESGRFCFLVTVGGSFSESNATLSYVRSHSGSRLIGLLWSGIPETYRGACLSLSSNGDVGFASPLPRAVDLTYSSEIDLGVAVNNTPLIRMTAESSFSAFNQRFSGACWTPDGNYLFVFSSLHTPPLPGATPSRFWIFGKNGQLLYSSALFGVVSLPANGIKVEIVGQQVIGGSVKKKYRQCFFKTNSAPSSPGTSNAAVGVSYDVEVLENLDSGAFISAEYLLATIKTSIAYPWAGTNLTGYLPTSAFAIDSQIAPPI